MILGHHPAEPTIPVSILLISQAILLLLICPTSLSVALFVFAQKVSTHETIKATPCAAPPASSSVSIPPSPSYFKSCVDHWKDGKRVSGQYLINHNNSGSFNVSCDFASESGWVWTLVMSQSHKNRAMPELRSTPLHTDAPTNENTPNWAAYRLSLDRMKALQSENTHWRVTCSFPAHGVDYRDYVGANFTELDPLTFQGVGICKKTEYMNVRGHDCTGCTSAWWQGKDVMIHHDSSHNKCEFGSTPGAVASEDNFGYYRETNPSFRCSSSDDSTTNNWFGRRVAWIIKNKVLGGPLPTCNPGGFFLWEVGEGPGKRSLVGACKADEFRRR